MAQQTALQTEVLTSTTAHKIPPPNHAQTTVCLWHLISLLPSQSQTTLHETCKIVYLGTCRSRSSSFIFKSYLLCIEIMILDMHLKPFLLPHWSERKCMPVDICGKRIYFLCDLKTYPFSLLYGLMPNYIIIFLKCLEWCDVISIHSYLLSCILCSENSCRMSVIIYSLFSIQNTLFLLCKKTYIKEGW